MRSPRSRRRSSRSAPRGGVDNPARVRADVPGGVFAVMPCVDHELGYAGLKSFLWLPGGTPFLVVLFSLADARLEAVVEADHLGQLRTAAGVGRSRRSTSRARRDDARRDRLRPPGGGACRGAARRAAGAERVLVHGRDPERRAAFCREHGCEEAASAGEAGGCDVVVIATTSREPVLRGEWLRAGAFVARSGRTSRRRASSTTRCSSARVRRAPTRVLRRSSRRAT